MRRRVRVVALLALSPLSALAQPPGAEASSPRGPSFSAGIGVAVAGQPYAEAEDAAQVFPIPLISYRSERLDFAGKTATLNAFERRAGDVTISVGVLADWRFQSYEAEDSPVLVGMEDRDGTLEVGGRLAAERDRARLTVTALADVLGRHDGYEVGARLGYELADGRARSVTPNVGLVYRSAALTGYYFGVRPEEALFIACVQEPCDDAPARPAYDPGGALSPSVGVTARQSLSRRITLFGVASYEVLPGEITDSPIVSDEGQVFGFGGIAYAFGG